MPYNDEAKSLLNQLRNSKTPEFRRHLLRCLQRYTINIFPYLLRELMKAQALESLCENSGLLALYENFYDHRFGVNINATISTDMFIQ